MKPKLSTLLILFLLLPFMVTSANNFPKPRVVDGSIKQHRVKIRWSTQTNVDYYRLRLYSGNCTERLDQYKINGSKQRKKLKGLDPDTKYCVKMRAHYLDGSHDAFSNPRRFRTLAENDSTTVDTSLRFGVNFVRYFSDTSDALAAATEPSVIEADYDNLGIDAMRQLTSADLIWSQLEVTDDQFDFTDSDAVLLTTQRTAIVDLFSYQLADSTTPQQELMGDTTPEKTLTAEAEEYVATVVDHYKDAVTYWEIGNEMAHWELEQPGAFPVAEQGLWLAAVAAVIREHDPDAQIILPSLINITETNTDDWLNDIVASAGSDWFDIVGYHHYNRWQTFTNQRAALQTTLDNLGITDKPVWQTETGTSSDSSNTHTTDYPNSTSQQAADIFRRSLQTYAAGDELMLWHTYIGNDTADEEFRYFGLINDDLTKQPAYYSVQLLNTVVVPFDTVTQDGDYIYQITKTDASIVYVAWSDTGAQWTVPADMTEYTSVVPADDGNFTWQNVSAGDTLTLTDIPILTR